MDVLMAEVIDALGKHGFWPLALGILIRLAWKLLPAVQGRLTRAIDSDIYGQKSVGTVELMKSSTFTQMDTMIAFNIDRIYIENPFKAQVSKDFLKLKLSTFRNGLFDFVQRPDIYTMSGDVMKDTLTEMFNGLIAKYEKDAADMGIPQLYIDKFRQWHDLTTRQTMKTIEGICLTSYITSNAEKMNAILISISSAFYATLIDAERTLGDINGHMKGLVYKGITCQ